ncbi:MAG TPA: glycerol-3-phosphate dehydrogenase/oxidase, partial [Gaiellaceae bacterium]|nr:glycerol-3-phosphate dehydrogenase/oxidase [Gaiellaceae bacterium]
RNEHSEEAEYWSPDRHRTISGEEAGELIPALQPMDPTSAYLFYDCQTDDARLVLTVLGEAERFGAVIVNGAEVTEVLEDGGKATGIAFTEAESGERIEVHAANVVNATGVWADQIRPGELLNEEEIPKIRPSRGSHITLSTEDLDIGTAACIVPAGSDRTIFALPWYGRVLVGTTDNDYEGGIDEVPTSGRDVGYLLEALNAYFGTDLDAGRLTGAYAGVRPLISSGDPKKSVDISRKAELYETSSGMLTITGGKLTTFRRMAAQVVDRIVEREGREAECRTDDIPLGMSARHEDLETTVELPEGATEQLAFRYGHAARAVLDLCEERSDLAEPIVPGRPDLMAEVVIAARREQARSVADVLLRRTRLGLVAEPGLRDGERVETVAAALGDELGWSAERVSEEAAGWSRVAEAEGLDPSRVAAP